MKQGQRWQKQRTEAQRIIKDYWQYWDQYRDIKFFHVVAEYPYPASFAVVCEDLVLNSENCHSLIFDMQKPLLRQRVFGGDLRRPLYTLGKQFPEITITPYSWMVAVHAMNLFGSAEYIDTDTCGLPRYRFITNRAIVLYTQEKKLSDYLKQAVLPTERKHKQCKKLD